MTHIHTLRNWWRGIVATLLLGCSLGAHADTWHAENYFYTTTGTVLMPETPYLEFQVIFQDFSGTNDEVRDMKFYLTFKNRSEKVQVLHYYRGRDAVNSSATTLYNPEYGTVTYHGSWESNDKELGKFRFYPSARAFDEGLQGFYIDSGWDIDQKGRVSYRFNKTFEISMPTPKLSHSIRRSGSETVDYRFLEPTPSSISPLSDFLKVGYTLSYDLYTDSARKQLVQSKKNAKADQWTTITTPFDNDAEVCIYPTISLARSFTVNNARGQACTVQHNFTYRLEPAKLEPMSGPKNLRASTDIWKKRITLAWNRPGDEKTTDKWYIYRRLASDPNPPTNVATLSVYTTTWTDEGSHLDYDTDYVYTVARVPEGWKSDLAPQGISQTTTAAVNRTLPITLTATPGDASIQLTWTHPAIKTSDASAAFRVMYSLNGSNSWEEAAKVALRSTSATEHTFTHNDITNSCNVYNYRVDITQIGATFSSNEVSSQINGTSHVSAVHASKGTFAGTVRVSWEAEQYGTTETRYEVYRRMLGSDDSWGRPVYSVSGTLTKYIYDDTNVAPGAFYEYKVLSQTICATSDLETTTYLLDDGFCQSAGSIGGQITYGEGVAVSGVRVSLAKNDESDTTPLTYSLHADGEMGGVIVADCEALVPQAHPFTLQLWASPDAASTTRGTLVDIDGMATLSHTAISADGTYSLVLRLPANAAATSFSDYPVDITLEAGRYAHLSLAYNGTGTWTVTHVAGADSITARTVTAPAAGKTIDRLAFGYAMSQGAEPFTGYIDDLRMWRHALTATEILANYDRMLSGHETDLCLYIPIDEGIKRPRRAYDYSMTDGIAGGHHGDIFSGDISPYVPEELHLYGVTDATGNYLIRGIPFSPAGTNYTLRPTMGTHEFSPTVQNRYVSSTSINHNSVNFTDNSSFLVTGDAFYAGTTIPVEGATLYVDGQACSRDGSLVQTDADGRYSVSVPIGRHFIEMRKDGHTFQNDGFWPERTDKDTAEKHYFEQPLQNLRFFDTTLVPVVGRVCGGAVQDSIAVGCGASINNIGTAELILSVGTSSFNVTRDQLGIAYDAQTRRDFDVPEEVRDWVHSTAWVEGGSFEQTSRLHIVTDAKTGEFSALLPPCDYKVESVRLTGPNPEDITFNDCPRLDATKVSVLQSDTVTVDGILRESPYVAAYKVCHHNDAVITVTETTNTDNAFGDDSCDVYDPGTGIYETISLYNVGDHHEVSYNYGYPIYTIGHEYEYRIHAAEHYTNYDNPDGPLSYEDVIAGAEVEVTNQFCGEQIVLQDNGELAGDAYSNKITLDADGNATYRFTAGYPNISSPYTRSLNIIVKQGGANIEWSQNGKFQAIVFGGLPTGSNFITQGPSQMFMVLHDPPGTNSSTTFAEGTTFSVSHSHSYSSSIGYTGTKDIHLGLSLKTVNGIGLALVDTKETKAEIDMKGETNDNYSYQNQNSYTITNSTAISTSSSPDFVGSQADVYYGASYNNIYGKMRCVGLYRNANGGYDLTMKEEMGIGDQFATTFAFTQFDLLYRVIPQLEEARDNTLLYDPNYIPGQPYSRKVDGQPIYITSLRPGDYGYGTLNTDKAVWGNRASDDPTEGPSFIMVMPEDAEDGQIFENSVHNYITYIHQWEDAIRRNEMDKVNAIQNGKAENVSVSSGAGYSASKSLTYSASESTSDGTSYSGSAVMKNGFHWNKVGVITTDGVHASKANTDTDSNSESHSISFSYSMGVGAPDRLSVDIYSPSISKSELQDELKEETPGDLRKLISSPIFVTRGGVTHNPYQGEDVTLFYKPGTIINEGTMAHEKPSITVVNDHITGLAPGSKVTFEVHLVNESESNDDVRYNFCALNNASTGKPKLTLNGLPFMPDTYTMSPKDDLVRYIVMEQTDLSETVLTAKLMLASTSQTDPTSPVGRLADYAVITAEFLPSSSPSTITAATNVVNTTTGTTLPLVIGGYDLGFKQLRGFELFYRYENETSLTPFKHWSLIGERNCEVMPEGTSFTCPIDMSSDSAFPDGTYTFIVRSYAGGDGAVISSDSEPFVVVKDTQRPVIVGNPSPNNFILGPNDVISVVFNEDIEKGRITKDNIIVTGRLNGAPVDHATAVQFDGTDDTPVSNIKFNICNHDFAGETWMLIHQPEETACIFSHGVQENGFALVVDHEGHLGLMTHGQPLFSEKTIDFGRWTYLTVNYTDNAGNGFAAFDAQVATDEGITTIFDHISLPRYSVNGPIQIGKRLNGALQELSFWNCLREPEVSVSECHQTKQLFTPGLVAYWPMSEGEGNIVHDYIHAYDLTAPNVSWYSAAPNCALALDGESYIDSKLDNTNFDEKSNYTLETWVRGDSQNATLLCLDNGTLQLGTRTDGSLTITTASGNVSNVTCNVLDRNWHHVALNMRRNGATNVYIDGNEAAQIKSNLMPALHGHDFTVGATRSQHNDEVSYTNHFTGDIDEVRLWNGTLTANFIRTNMNARIDTLKCGGLIAYLPFEETTDGITRFTTADKSTLHAEVTASDHCTEAISWPALKAIPQLQRLDYDFVATERSITIRLKDDPARIHGNPVQVALRNIYDLHGNVSNYVNWNFYNNVLSLGWKQEEVSLYLSDSSGYHTTEQATFSNLTSRTLSWYIDDLPVWLEANTTSGLIDPLGSVTIEFSTVAPYPTESVIEAVNLYDSDGICYPLPIELYVYQEMPSWYVDEKAFDGNMTLVAKVFANGKINDSESSMLAAFCDDQLVGTAMPIYSSRYDSFFIPMTIYGNADMEGHAVKFKFWNARTGIIYSPLDCNRDITFNTNAFYGSYTDPVVFQTTNLMEQNLAITPTWTWASLYLNTEENTMAGILRDEASSVELVKTQNESFDMTDTDKNGDYAWTTSHVIARPGTMYMIKARSEAAPNIIGSKANPADVAINVKGKQWNWIGYVGTRPMTVKAALSSIIPSDGDIIKSQTKFAIYNGEWDGTLTQLSPGEGYMYYSSSEEDRTFTYPTIEEADRISPFQAPRHTAEPTHFQPVAPGLFAGNMTILASLLTEDAEAAANDAAELAVFAGDECRAVAKDENGLFYLTIPGEAVEPLTFLYFDGTQERAAQPAETLYYRSNTHYGSPSEPYIVTLSSNSEGINAIAADGVRINLQPEADRIIVTASALMQHVDIVSPSGALLTASVAPAKSVSLPISTLAPGVYYVRITLADGRTAVKTFVKHQ